MMVRSKQRRSGVVLLAVLVVIVLLSLAAYQYSALTMAEYKASEYAQRQTQARAYADAGVNYAAAVLSDPNNVQNVLGGNPYHNPGALSNVVVQADAASGYPGKFTLMAPGDPNDTTVSVRNGVTDETGKLNVNALMLMDPTGQVLHDSLMLLPNMTDDIAWSIVDWIDADDEPKTGGAESDYYSGLSPPYRAKNGPLESLEELLLVKGVTPQLLYGNDRNRNGIADPGEVTDGGTLDRGWSAFLTIYSRERLIDSQGQPLVNVNGSDLTSVYQSLSGTGTVSDDLAKFIVLYRIYGADSSGQTFTATMSTGSGGQIQLQFQMSSGGKGKQTGGGKGGGGGGGTGGGNQQPVNGTLASLSLDQLDLTKSGSKINSFFSLVNATITVPAKDNKSPSTVYTSPLTDPSQTSTLLPALFNAASVSDQTEIPARINVNTAPAEVIAAIPGIQDADVQSILATRPSLTSTDPPSDMFLTPTWLLTQANMQASTLQNLEKYITTRSQVYRVQAVGMLDGAGPSARVEAVIDTNGGAPRILSWRDLTELGAGLNK